MKKHSLEVELRSETGKNACNRLRDSGYIPAVLFSHGNSETIKVQNREFSSLFKGHISESVIIDLNIKDKSESSNLQAFVKDYQLHPVTDEIIHLDFYKITEGEKIRTFMPIEISGTPAGVKIGGSLEIIERELEIECLPKDLPEKIIIDVEKLQIGESLHIKDLPPNESVKFLSSSDRIILAVSSPRVTTEEIIITDEGIEDEGIEMKSEQDSSKDDKDSDAVEKT